MNRSILVLFAAFALVLAAPVLAQDEVQEETQLQPYESRTNPDADSIAGDSGLTITGTVVEWNDEQLALKTTTGIEHVQILPNTEWSTELTEGEKVSVDYTRTTQGVMIASKIRTAGEMQTETDTDVVATTTTSTTTESEMEMEADTDVDVRADADLDTDADWNDGEADVTADFDADTELDTVEADADLDTDAEWSASDELPSTGSEMPLLGLLGLLSLVAAVGVRSFLR